MTNVMKNGRASGHFVAAQAAIVMLLDVAGEAAGALG
jgi:hypothetical protein